MDINKVIAWTLTFIMSGAAAKLWSDLDVEIKISKQKSEAVEVYADLWEKAK